VNSWGKKSFPTGKRKGRKKKKTQKDQSPSAKKGRRQTRKKAHVKKKRKYGKPPANPLCEEGDRKKRKADACKGSAPVEKRRWLDLERSSSGGTGKEGSEW